jgi:energy-coupling factor transporter ATP-binding protein EcfA2
MPLDLRGATYRYAGAPKPALSEITLTVEPGAVIGVAGANDAGKSTLCLVASGLAPAVVGGHLSGDVAIDGTPTTGLKPYELAQRCGILFQNAVTQLSGTTRSVWEEIAFGPRNLGLSLGEVAARVDQAMALLAIATLQERDPGRLSGGQAQLVALASVLALRPRYLVLDEPTSQLDPQGTRLVGDALAGFASDAGTGVLLVEHKTDLLARLATRVVILDGGRIAREGQAAEVLGDPGLAELGVEPPAAVTVARAAAAAGVTIDRAALAVDR